LLVAHVQDGVFIRLLSSIHGSPTVEVTYPCGAFHNPSLPSSYVRIGTCGNYRIARGLCRRELDGRSIVQVVSGELHVVVGAICSTKHNAKYGQCVQVKYDLYQQKGFPSDFPS
jgi:hypothetical protein